MSNFNLRKEFVSYGHFKVTATIEGQEYSVITTNTMATDAAFDDCYDDVDNSGRFFETRQDAINALISEIERKNNLIQFQR